MVYGRYLDVLHRSEGSKELPENVLLSFWGQIVYKDAPARSVGGHPWQQSVARQQVSSQGGEPKPGELQLLRSIAFNVGKLCSSIVIMVVVVLAQFYAVT